LCSCDLPQFCFPELAAESFYIQMSAFRIYIQVLIAVPGTTCKADVRFCRQRPITAHYQSLNSRPTITSRR
jgi:hypothetical protein